LGEDGFSSLPADHHTLLWSVGLCQPENLLSYDTPFLTVL